MYLLKSEVLEKLSLNPSELKDLYDQNRSEFERLRCKELEETEKNIEKNQKVLYH